MWFFLVYKLKKPYIQGVAYNYVLRNSCNLSSLAEGKIGMFHSYRVLHTLLGKLMVSAQITRFKRILIIAVAFMGIFVAPKVFAQNNVGIGTTTPHPSSSLEVFATDKGLLIPRVSSTTAVITPTADGLIIFNTTDRVFQYYSASLGWQTMLTTGDIDGITWLTSGNTGTNSASDYIGTTDNVALVFRTNGVPRVTIGTDGTVTLSYGLVVTGSSEVQGNSVVQGNSTVSGNASVSGNNIVTGLTSTGTLVVSGTTATGNIQVNGDISASGNLFANGNATVNGDALVYGGDISLFNGANSITLKAPVGIIPHQIIFPPENQSGSLFNDGLGNLSWSATSATASGLAGRLARFNGVSSLGSSGIIDNSSTTSVVIDAAGSATFTSNIGVAGALQVTGATTLQSSLQVLGSTTLQNASANTVAAATAQITSATVQSLSVGAVTVRSTAGSASYLLYLPTNNTIGSLTNDGAGNLSWTSPYTGVVAGTTGSMLRIAPSGLPEAGSVKDFAAASVSSVTVTTTGAVQIQQPLAVQSTTSLQSVSLDGSLQVNGPTVLASTATIGPAGTPLTMGIVRSTVVLPADVILDNAEVEESGDIIISGVEVGATVYVSASALPAGVFIGGAYSSAANTIRIRLGNLSGATTTVDTSVQFFVTAFK